MRTPHGSGLVAWTIIECDNGSMIKDPETQSENDNAADEADDRGAKESPMWLPHIPDFITKRHDHGDDRETAQD